MKNAKRRMKNGGDGGVEMKAVTRPLTRLGSLKAEC
jgi:hypothetical protein